MLRAIELAHAWNPHPNPRVGAVIVDDTGTIVGAGAHVSRGEDHAEVVALAEAGGRARGATMYVTLEPCSHQGLTPPCVGAIIDAGISRVVVGAGDPDERVLGSGLSALRQAGIEIVDGIMTESVHELDPGYFHHRKTGLPWVTLKYAMTVDGAVAAADGTSQWITSEEARRDAHALRSRADGVVVGSGTLSSDDPRLDVRLEGYDGPQPSPVIIAGAGELSSQARIWQRDPTVVSTFERRIPTGNLIVVEGEEGLPDPVTTCRTLADAGLLALLVEGGPRLAAGWLSAGVVNRGVAYIGAKLGGGAGIGPVAGVLESIGDARVVSITGVRSLGPDYRIDFEL